MSSLFSYVVYLWDGGSYVVDSGKGFRSSSEVEEEGHLIGDLNDLEDGGVG